MPRPEPGGTVGPMREGWLWSAVVSEASDALRAMIACGYCGAGSGDPCRTRTTGARAQWPHAARYRDASPAAETVADAVLRHAHEFTEWHRRDVEEGRA